MREYNYRTRDLLKALVKVGFSKNVSSGHQKLFRLKWAGKFTPPKMDTNGRWMFTERQMYEITRSLTPGGKGEWHFNPMQDM